MIRAPRARRLILPAAAVAAILLGAGLAFALAGRPPASPNPAAKATAPASHADKAGPGQGQPQVPRVSLASVRWSGFYGVELPVSAQAGPFGTSRGRRGGLRAHLRAFFVFQELDVVDEEHVDVAVPAPEAVAVTTARSRTSPMPSRRTGPGLRPGLPRPAGSSSSGRTAAPE